ncbi:MAG: laccase domain-containing protein, partial [Lachnospiraceae bacterium]|nr:laccase domain-containing protein [Lachnospiraceae bacterium]
TDLFFINPHGDKFDLDLGKAIEISLIKAGVKKENFFDTCPCTKESDNLCSWRRDNPIRQSMLTGLMINK